jgi:CDP-2,3-bis-(O-geranylgeranyl)-sn-glycerol synthase
MLDFLSGIWFILPAYVASSSAVLFGGRIVIDFNKKFLGRPLFGKGKTVSGFAGGVLAGSVIGFILSFFSPVTHFNMDIYTGFIIAFGAMSGDLAGSFIKRRIGFKRGESAILLDQLDFVAGALIFGYLINVLPTPEGIIFILILTPFLHLFANRIAYLWKLKKRPW